jgi:hypothetical protein
MKGLFEQANLMQGIKYFGPALVVASDDPNGRVKVMLDRIDASEHMQEEWAHMALATPVSLKAGDMALVAGEQPDNLYIIGILDAARKRTGQDLLTAQCGARAELHRDGTDERLKIISSRGELVFEYDPLSGKSFVAARAGDLEISAARTLHLKSDTLEISAKRGKIALEETEFSGERFTVTVHIARLFAERLESTAATVIQKAINSYTAVKELTQLSSGRLRTLVDGVWQAKSKKAFLKAEDDFKVKGEKIYLG